MKILSPLYILAPALPHHLPLLGKLLEFTLAQHIKIQMPYRTLLNIRTAIFIDKRIANHKGNKGGRYHCEGIFIYVTDVFASLNTDNFYAAVSPTRDIMYIRKRSFINGKRHSVTIHSEKF